MQELVGQRADLQTTVAAAKQAMWRGQEVHLSMAELKAVLGAADRALSLEQTFDLYWDKQEAAVNRWRAAYPNRTIEWPDHADLCVWLMSELERAKARRKPGALRFWLGVLALIPIAAWLWSEDIVRRR